MCSSLHSHLFLIFPSTNHFMTVIFRLHLFCEDRRGERSAMVVPNLDLMLLAFLYGALLACVLLAAIAAVLIGLLLAFFLALCTVAVVDILHVYSFVYRHLVTVQEDVKFGLVMVLCMAVYCVVYVAVALEPMVRRLAFGFKMTTKYVTNRLDALFLVTAQK